MELLWNGADFPGDLPTRRLGVELHLRVERTRDLRQSPDRHIGLATQQLGHPGTGLVQPTRQAGLAHVLFGHQPGNQFRGFRHHCLDREKSAELRSLHQNLVLRLHPLRLLPNRGAGSAPDGAIHPPQPVGNLLMARGLPGVEFGDAGENLPKLPLLGLDVSSDSLGSKEGLRTSRLLRQAFLGFGINADGEGSAQQPVFGSPTCSWENAVREELPSDSQTCKRVP
jgi:hypothetical protein